MPNKPFRFGHSSRRKSMTVECSVCGVPFKPVMDDSAETCKDCAGAQKQKRRLPDKAEEVDRDEDDETSAEWRDAYLDYASGAD